MTKDHLERIRERAHSIWEQQGRPNGAAEAHWHQASAEIATKVAPAARSKAAAAKATTATKRRSVPAGNKTPV